MAEGARIERSVPAALAAAALLAGAVALIATTPVPLLALALGPALVLAAGLVRLAPPPPLSPARWLAALLWGLTLAPLLAAAGNDALRVWLASTAGAALASTWSARLGAPLIEEGVKALGVAALLWGRRAPPGDARAGMMLGAAVGLGFTAAESCHYFALAALGGGVEALAESVYLRAALGGPLHAVFGATAGAGLGAAASGRGRRRATWALLGGALAVAQHAAWNAAGAPWLDAAPCGPAADACALAGRLRYWMLTAPAIVAAFLVPGLVGLALVWRRTRAWCPGRPLG